MQLRSNVKALSFVKKLLENDTEHLLPFAPLAQKPLAPMYDGVRFPRSTPAARQAWVRQGQTSVSSSTPAAGRK